MSIDVDALAEEMLRGTQLLIAKAVAKIGAEIGAENEALRSDLAAAVLRIAELETRAPVPGPQGERGEKGDKGDRGDDGAPGRDGLDGKDGATGERGADGAPGRDGVDGKDGAPGPQGERGEVGRQGSPGPQGERGADGADGVLRQVEPWQDRVHYRGECVTHNGSTWQAKSDTGKSPGPDDWVCIARAGGIGRSFTVRGTYDAADSYEALDVVACNGGSFVAVKDGAGPCPGPDWQLLASPGKRGAAGHPGQKGERGADGLPGRDGAAIIAGTLQTDGVMRLARDDGEVIEVDMYAALRGLA